MSLGLALPEIGFLCWVGSMLKIKPHGGKEGKRAQSQLWPDAIWGHASEAKEEHTPVDQQRPNQHQTVPAFLPILP